MLAQSISDRPPSWQQKIVLVLLVCSLLAAVWWLLAYLGMPEKLSPQALADWVDQGGALGPLLMVLLMVLAVVVGPLPTLPVSAASGLVFGLWAGTAIAVLGATIGAGVAFGISRLLGRDLTRQKLPDNMLFAPEAPQAVLFWGILVTRLVPVFSFALVSYAAGLTAVTLGRFLLASIIGMLPMTLVFVGLGQGFQIHPIASLVAGALLLTVMMVVPYYARGPLGRYLKNENKKRG